MNRHFAFLCSLGILLGAANTAWAVPGAVTCYNGAVDTLNQALAAKRSADASGSALAASTSAAQLNTAGKSSTGAGSGQSAGAGAASSSCAALAQRAKTEGAACLQKYTSSNDQSFLNKQLNSNLYPQADSTIAKCSQSSAGYASTANSLSGTSNALLMMTALGGLASMGGGGSSDSGNYSTAAVTTPSTTTTTPTYTPPHVTSVANDRTDNSGDVAESESSKPMNLGDPDVLAVDDGAAGEGDEASARALAAYNGAGDKTALATDTAATRSLASAAGTGAANATGEIAIKGSKEDMSGIADIGGFGFDAAATGVEAKPEEANDAGFLGKNKKTKVSLAAALAQKKKLDAEAKAQQKEEAAAQARKIASTFKADVKSCAERNWVGKECKALKADPLLNVK